MLLQRQIHSIRPLTTAHLAQTMTLLGLTVAELRQKIEAELASNPALEVVEEHRCPICHRTLIKSGPCPLCSHPVSINSDEPIVFLASRDDFRPGSSSSISPEDVPDDSLAPEVIDLPHFVLRQIATELRPDERPLAAHILTNLNEDGLLAIPLVEVARYHHVPLARVEKVLRLIQHAEPVGVGSPTPEEALLVQLEVLQETHSVPALAAEAICQGMGMLSKHHYAGLARLLHISIAQAHEIARFISENLNPFPARAFWGDIHQSAVSEGEVFHEPDVIISRLSEASDAPLVVEIALPFSGMLRINPLFREALHLAPAGQAEQWQADLERAGLLVKCIHQRDHTIVRLMKCLASLQRQFILHGDSFLEPLTRASLAEELDVHESTISRAVSEKAVQLPNGKIVPLARFFDRSLQVRTALKTIIDQETTALSDTEIVARLAQLGYPVARRTVAKYRAMEGILPAYLRHATCSRPRP